MKSASVWCGVVLVWWCGVVVCASSPTPQTKPTPVPILINYRSPFDSHGTYSFRYRTGNGINQSQSHEPGAHGRMVTKGRYTFRHPDGSLHTLRYTADENGFQPDSDLLPTPFPLEPWQEEQVRFAEKERRLKALQEALHSRHRN